MEMVPIERQPKRYRSALALDGLDAVEGGASFARPRRRRPPSGAARPRHVPRNRRLLRAAAIVLTVTWLPGIAGNALSISWLTAPAKACGYVGLSWVLPAYFIGLAMYETARRRGSNRDRLVGIVAWAGSALILLIGAAALIGS